VAPLQNVFESTVKFDVLAFWRTAVKVKFGKEVLLLHEKFLQDRWRRWGMGPSIKFKIRPISGFSPPKNNNNVYRSVWRRRAGRSMGHWTPETANFTHFRNIL